MRGAAPATTEGPSGEGGGLYVAPPTPTAVMVAEVVVVVGLFAWAPSTFFAIVTAVAAVLLLVLQSRPARLELRSEALVWRWSGLRQDALLSRIEGVAVEGQDLEVRLAGGKRRTFRAMGEPSELEAFVGLVERSSEAARAAAPRALLPALERGARDHASWASELQRLVGSEHFRRRRIEVDDLLEVALDGTAPLEARGAAIVAAYPHAGGEARARVRHVADRTALEPLAELIEEVEAEAEGSRPSDELCRALAALEAR